MDDGGDGVEEGKLRFAGQSLDGARERRRGEGPGRHDNAVPVARRQAADLPAGDLDEGVRFEGPRHLGGETLAVDRESASRRQLVRVGSLHDQRAGTAHLLVQQADGIGLPFVRAEGVRADQLGKRRRLVRLGLALGAHLVERDRHAAARELPGRLAPGKAASDDMNFAGHG